MPALPSTHEKTPTGFLMVLRQGADVLAELAGFMQAEQVPAASVVGFGFAGEVTFGFFDFARRTYDPRSFHNVEIASLTGTLAWKDGQPSLHFHAMATDEHFNAVGGHLLALQVGSGSMELTILLHDRRLERALEPSIGANILLVGSAAPH